VTSVVDIVRRAAVPLDGTAAIEAMLESVADADIVLIGNGVVALRRKAAEYATRDGRIAADDQFAAEQNARVIRNAENYYRAMFVDGGVP